MLSHDDPGLLNELVVDTQTSFRERSQKVGTVYTMDYRRAIVAIYDFDREQAGGLPKSGFLIAAKQEEDESFILLRILREARLPNAIANDQTRQQGIESTVNEHPWADALDPWMRDRVSLHGIECRILGTFIYQDKEYKFAEDTDNYYAVNDLMVWKPDTQTLNLIVNYRHRKNAISANDQRRKIGQTRFAAAEKETATKANVLLDPTDMLQRRTVYLGMSRSGKSNAMKITAEGIYRLREENPENKIGQLIFDPNGEYAQDNPQDGPGLHRIHEALGRPRAGEVETYGLFPTESDQDRKIMKVNFFGDPFPQEWSTPAVETALDQMLAGREIIQEVMADVDAQYTKAFRDVDLSVPEIGKDDYGSVTRYRRAVLVHQAALAAAGLKPPQWQPSIKGLFRVIIYLTQ